MLRSTPARCAAIALAAATAFALSACGGNKNNPPGAIPSAFTDISSSTPAPTATATAAPPSSKPPTVKALTCKQVADSQVQSATIKLTDYPLDSMNLADGLWSGEDGTTIEFQQACGIGDLNGDEASDALGSVKITFTGTGRYWALVAWRNSGGSPTLAATLSLGDRNPVESISISGGKAKVVYLTRNDGEPMAALTIRRTAFYRLTGSALTEESHSDSPYSG